MISDYKNKIEVFLDDNQEPIAVYQPPARFELDTSQLEDGEHHLKFIAYSDSGKKSFRKIKFIVRNGPGITVNGIKENEIVEGKLNLLVNAYGGTTDSKWEPTSAETPSPIPSWIWVMLILIIAWAVFYFINQWSPSEEFANTPTYRKLQPLASEEKFTSALNLINGADIYRKSCSSCHQENGQGLPNVFPSLNNSDVVKSENPSDHIKTVLFGLSGKEINGVKYQTPMPAWADQLSDEEVAAVINHERSSWGNGAKLVTPEDVKTLRVKLK